MLHPCFFLIASVSLLSYQPVLHFFCTLLFLSSSLSLPSLPLVGPVHPLFSNNTEYAIAAHGLTTMCINQACILVKFLLLFQLYISFLRFKFYHIKNKDQFHKDIMLINTNRQNQELPLLFLELWSDSIILEQSILTATWMDMGKLIPPTLTSAFPTTSFASYTHPSILYSINK